MWYTKEEIDSLVTWLQERNYLKPEQIEPFQIAFENERGILFLTQEQILEAEIAGMIFSEAWEH